MSWFRETFAGRAVNLVSGGRLLVPPDPPLPEKGAPDRAPLSPVLSRHLSTALSRSLSRRSVLSDTPTAAEVDEKRANAQLVEWSGPDDPENPHNWSVARKVYVSSLVNILTFSIYIGSAIYTSGVAGVSEQFHVSHVVATLGLSLFVFGYGLGPMFLAPLSEAPPIGRMPVYIITHLIFIFFNFGVVYAKNIGMLLAFRFLTGFFGSPVLATGGASLGDLWTPKKVAYAVGIWGNFAVLGPVLGPLAAGFAVMAKGWQWSIWELIWLNGFTAILLILTMPETSGENILYRRAQRLRETTGDPGYRTAAEVEVANTPVSELLIGALVRPFSLMLTEPILIAQNTYLGLVYALLYCWFEAFPIVFVGTYGFNLGELGLAYLGILVGAIVMTPPYFIWIRRSVEPHVLPDGSIEPERRLPPAIVGSLCLPVCLFWFGWTARASVPWIVPIIGSSFFSIGAALLFNALLSYQGDAYPRVVGSVLAGNDFARAAFGGGFPLFATAMFDTLGIDWGCSLLGFLSIAFIPIPILIYHFGKRLRKSSKMARHDV